MTNSDNRLLELERENNSLRGAILVLHRIANLVRGAVELEPTYYALLTGVTAGVGLGLNRAMLFLLDGDNRNQLRGAAAVGPANPEEADRVWRSILADGPDLETLYEVGLRERDQPGELDRVVRALRIDAGGESPVARALRGKRTVMGEDATGDDLEGLLHLPTAVAAPLRGRQGIAGVLYADNIYTKKTLSSVSRLIFSLIADHAGRAIESAHQFEEIALQARTDALTGLAHHGTLMEELGLEVARAKREAGVLGVIMVDLDDFKKINDTLGHLAGDALLAGVAARIRSVARTGESPFRYGGEEFALVLPGAKRSAAADVGERVRRAVAEQPYIVNSGDPRWVTCSVGVSSFPQDGGSVSEVVAAADAALLRAKALGKNRVELAKP